MTATNTAFSGGYQLHQTIVLVGMMGSGKTAIGKALAQSLGVSFSDSDEEIVSAAQQSISDIFERDGEAFFRMRETEVITRLLAQSPGVMSTGGGAFLRDENREVIDASGVSVWLDAPLDLLWDRVRGKDTRPLLRTANPLVTLTEIYEERTPVYAKAGLRLKVRPGSSIGQTTDDLIELLAARADVLEISQ